MGLIALGAAVGSRAGHRRRAAAHPRPRPGQDRRCSSAPGSILHRRHQPHRRRPRPGRAGHPLLAGAVRARRCSRCSACRRSACSPASSASPGPGFAGRARLGDGGRAGCSLLGHRRGVVGHASRMLLGAAPPTAATGRTAAPARDAAGRRGAAVRGLLGVAARRRSGPLPSPAATAATIVRRAMTTARQRRDDRRSDADRRVADADRSDLAERAADCSHAGHRARAGRRPRRRRDAAARGLPVHRRPAGPAHRAAPRPRPAQPARAQPGRALLPRRPLRTRDARPVRHHARSATRCRGAWSATATGPAAGTRCAATPGPPPAFGDRRRAVTRSVTVEGAGVYEIPVGPVHAGLIEPGHFRFSVVGETILKLKARLWFVHKGIEKLFEGRTAGRRGRARRADQRRHRRRPRPGLLPGRRGRPRHRRCRRGAARPRAVLLELERLYNHVADIGALCNDVGHARPQRPRPADPRTAAAHQRRRHRAPAAARRDPARRRRAARAARSRRARGDRRRGRRDRRARARPQRRPRPVHRHRRAHRASRPPTSARSATSPGPAGSPSTPATTTRPITRPLPPRPSTPRPAATCWPGSCVRADEIAASVATHRPH